MSQAAQKITIYRGFRNAGAFVWSPFVTKLEARFRFAGLNYAVEAGSPRSGPKGKIPYITLGENTTLGDSALIIEALTADGKLPDLHARLSRADRAHDLALRALLEEKLTGYHIWERWTQNFYTMREHVLWALPWPVRVVVGSMIHRNIVSMLHGQGTGRFTAEEIGHFRREIWESFADLALESQTKAAGQAGEPFWVLGGPEPTEIDASLFGFIVSAWITTAGPGSQADLKSFPVLLEYARRIQGRYFPDYEALPREEN